MVMTCIGKLARLVIAAATCGALFVASSVPVFAEDTGTVAATVTAASPCITLDVSSVSFGTLPLNTSNLLSGGAGVSPSYTNCSAQDETVYGRATDASGTGVAWTLVTDGVCPGTNRFALDLQLQPQGQQIAIGKANTVLATTAPGSRQTTRPLISMPCTGSAGAGQQMSFDIVYTATF